MTLHLRATCDVLAELAVTNGDRGVPIRDIHEFKTSYGGADCPVAFILPSDDETGADFTPMALDSQGYIIWSVVVQYLEAPFEEGRGWTQCAEAVAMFTENFIQAIIDAKASFCANNTMMVGVSPRRGVYEFPRGSGQWFYGAQFIVRVKDFTRVS